VDDLVYQHKAKREILVGSILRTEDLVSGMKVLCSLQSASLLDEQNKQIHISMWKQYE